MFIIDYDVACHYSYTIQTTQQTTGINIMNIQFVGIDKVGQSEQSNYWFDVDGDQYAIADNCGETKLLDSEGYPIEECNDHDRIKDALLSEYEKQIMVN